MAQNGHVVPPNPKIAYEARRRQPDVTYLALPGALLDDFERLAMHHELAVRVGALQLLALIRRRARAFQAGHVGQAGHGRP